MCATCDAEAERQWAQIQATPVPERPVPWWSGEAAIYSPEYLERKEGNAYGAEPDRWYQVS